MASKSEIKISLDYNNFNFKDYGLGRMEKSISGDNSIPEPQKQNVISKKSPAKTFRSTRKAFLPLGTIAKCFGLFPSYKLTFAESCQCPRKRLIDYLYSGSIFLFIVVGLILCIRCNPAVIEGMSLPGTRTQTTDSIVIMGVFYTSMGMGILTRLNIPRKICSFISYLEHFENVDKILHFGKESEKAEEKFGRVLATTLILAVVVVGSIFTCLFVLESPQIPKTYLDYIMVVVEILSEMANLTPTVFIVFFLHSIRLRLQEFNHQIERIVLPITPSCASCLSYSDYGRELEGQVCFRKSEVLAQDLEKMRILHEEISILVDKTSEIFGSHFIRDFLYSIVGMVLYSYFMLFVRGSGEGGGMKYWFIFPCLDIFIVCKLIYLSSCAHLITKEVINNQ